MPGSFLARHRTICEVLEEIRTHINDENFDGVRLGSLIDEAKDYAQRMSRKLMEYKLNTGPVSDGQATEVPQDRAAIVHEPDGSGDTG